MSTPQTKQEYKNAYEQMKCCANCMHGRDVGITDEDIINGATITVHRTQLGCFHEPLSNPKAVGYRHVCRAWERKT
jgi:hypothetical protein